MLKSDVLRIPPRRLEQLRAIGGVLHLSVADTVAHLIRKEVAAGTIPAGIPGIVIKKVAGGVSIQIDDGPAKSFSSDAARGIVAAIRNAVAGKAGTVNMDEGYMFMARGAGFKLAAPWPGEEHSLSRDLALEIAGLIEQAAK